MKAFTISIQIQFVYFLYSIPGNELKKIAIVGGVRVDGHYGGYHLRIVYSLLKLEIKEKRLNRSQLEGKSLVGMEFPAKLVALNCLISQHVSKKKLS